MMPITRADLILVGSLLAIAAAAFVLFPTNLALFSRIAAVMLLVLSLDLVTGVGGIATLGQAALFGAGAYTAGLAAVHLGLTDPLAMLVLGTAGGTLVGFLSGLVVLRGHGFTQLVLSIAVAQLLHEGANKFAAVTGGSDGLAGFAPAAVLGIWRFDLWGRTGYWFAVATVLFSVAVLRIIMRSPFGLLCQAIRQDPTRVRFLGMSVYRTQAKLYALAGSVAGLGGALSAVTTKVVAPDSLSFTLSAEALVMLVLGGAGRLVGALLGTALFMSFEHVVAAINPFHWLLLVGVLLIVVVLFAPRGIAGLFARRRAS